MDYKKSFAQQLWSIEQTAPFGAPRRISALGSGAFQQPPQALAHQGRVAV